MKFEFEILKGYNTFFDLFSFHFYICNAICLSISVFGYGFYMNWYWRDVTKLKS